MSIDVGLSANRAQRLGAWSALTADVILQRSVGLPVRREKSRKDWSCCDPIAAASR
jgi:hypothetical protein